MGLIDEYRLACYKKIGHLGEKGSLWLVQDSVSGKYFVMRELTLENQEVYERMRSLCHPNVVRIFEMLSVEGKIYAIEEYVKGQPLSGILEREGPLGRRAFSVGKQVLQALAILHKNGIIHRDIKPGNIMMDEKGNIKLIDFHIARILKEDNERDTTIKGSRAYASPEQFGFKQTDCRADI